MVELFVTAGSGGCAPGGSAASVAARLLAWLDARLFSTLCTCSSATWLPATAEDATADSADVMLCAAPPETLMGADATADRMLSAASCNATDSVAVAFTTASTSDAALAASEALRLPTTDWLPTAALSDVSSAPCAALAVLASKLDRCVATAPASMLLAFIGAGAATAGADTAMPVQAVSPELCIAAT
jgi:hypothetical protein